jgi:hypothetical protein
MAARQKDLARDPGRRSYDSTFLMLCKPLRPSGGLHFSRPIAPGDPTGDELAATEIINWLSKRHELVPPA